MIACTLSGPGLLTTAGDSSSPPQSCSAAPGIHNSSVAHVCAELDGIVQSWHILAPWCITLSAVVVLGLPTLFFRYRRREKGLRCFAGTIVFFLALLLCGRFILGPISPTVHFVYGLHACVHFLVRLDGAQWLYGGVLWWGLRYAVVVSLIGWQIFQGPPAPLILWPGSTLSPSSQSCAHLSHLFGSMGPGVVLGLVGWVVGFANFIDIKDV